MLAMVDITDFCQSKFKKYKRISADINFPTNFQIKKKLEYYFPLCYLNSSELRV